MSLLLGFLQQAPRVHGATRNALTARCHRALQANAETLLDRPVARQRVQPLISIDQILGSAAGRDNLSVKPIDQKLELSVLIEVLPSRVKALLQDHPNLGQLVEVVLDLGRPVLARFADTDQLLSTTVLTRQELEEVTSKVTEFGGDNRAGIDRCLHRISCMRNRDGLIVGLTCRVGRAVPGSANLVADVVLSGRSILLLGRPGVGKTTAIRDISRMLAVVARKRVVIIDTSNEIAGDGNVPHHAIASARRMQVPVPEQQHRVMIEAVENHMPEVIVIDEIGSEAEALAAATIAQRGVQLVATAHGDRLENILNNPTLQSLLGSVESVILGDETAKKRGVQKSIRERAGPPTFDCCIEMEDRQHWRLYDDVATACDGILAGKEVKPQMRYRDAEGNAFTGPDNRSDSRPGKAPTASKFGTGTSAKSSFSTQSTSSADASDSFTSSSASDSDSDSDSSQVATPLQRLQAAAGIWKMQQPRKRRTGGGKDTASSLSDLQQSSDQWQQQPEKPAEPAEPPAPPMQVYVHGIEEEVLETVLKRSNLWHRVQLRDSLRGCDAAIGLRGKIKSGGWLRNAAKNFDVPIFSVKTSSPEHLTKAAQTILGLEPSSGGLFGGLFGSSRSSDAQSSNSSQTALQARPVRDDRLISEAQLPPRAQVASEFESPDDAQDSEEEEEEEEEDEEEEEEEEEWYLREGMTVREPQRATSKAMSFGPKPLGYQAAMDEAIVAIEQVVIPRNQPIELLPRPAEILDMQMRIAHQYDMVCEVVGEDRKVRLRISPHIP